MELVAGRPANPAHLLERMLPEQLAVLSGADTGGGNQEFVGTHLHAVASVASSASEVVLKVDLSILGDIMPVQVSYAGDTLTLFDGDQRPVGQLMVPAVASIGLAGSKSGQLVLTLSGDRAIQWVRLVLQGQNVPLGLTSTSASQKRVDR